MEIKFFARKIFKPLNKMGDHIVHIILKTFLNIPISLAVRASLGINNSLILVLYPFGEDEILRGKGREG